MAVIGAVGVGSAASPIGREDCRGHPTCTTVIRDHPTSTAIKKTGFLHTHTPFFCVSVTTVSFEPTTEWCISVRVRRVDHCATRLREEFWRTDLLLIYPQLSRWSMGLIR